VEVVVALINLVLIQQEMVKLVALVEVEVLLRVPILELDMETLVEQEHLDKVMQVEILLMQVQEVEVLHK
jgi:hypothetical protein